MAQKVLLILSDGLRPDAYESFMPDIMAHSKFNLATRTVMPSVTLPCHMSLFHSVTPERHGILTNTYVPQVRPVRGLCDVLGGAGKKCGIFYDWEELKDLWRPGSIEKSCFISGHFNAYDDTCVINAKEAVKYINEKSPDFVFLYLGLTDEAGHGYGWMSEKYLEAANKIAGICSDVINSIPDEYITMITADHGGHSRGHGSDMDEDMTIPLLIHNKAFEKQPLGDANIIDIAPTITALLGVAPDGDWEGKNLLG